jgi:hypothetical protein
VGCWGRVGCVAGGGEGWEAGWRACWELEGRKVEGSSISGSESETSSIRACDMLRGGWRECTDQCRCVALNSNGVATESEMHCLRICRKLKSFCISARRWWGLQDAKKLIFRRLRG